MSESKSIASWLLAFCNYLAPLSSILLYLSPIPTIRKVLRMGTVGDLPLLPYSSMSASCFVWIIYGILKGEATIYLTNIIELLLSIYYFFEFTNYAPLHSSPSLPGSVYSHIQICASIWITTIVLALFGDVAAGIIGNITVLLTILTFASPLAAVKAVLEHQSSEAIPWHFTLAAFFNCCLWTIVGVFEMHDVYVYFPAILGLLFASLQIALKLKYSDHDDYTVRHAAMPVEMNPVLKTVRQIIMYGNNNDDYAQQHNNMYEGLGDLQLQVDITAPLVEDGTDDEEIIRNGDKNDNVVTPAPNPPPPPLPSPTLGAFRLRSHGK